MVSEMMPTCKWCNKPLTAGFALLCPDCKERIKHNEQTAAKAATDHTARWNWLEPLPKLEPVAPHGNGKTTHVRCHGCRQEVTTTSLDMYVDCPTCGEKLRLRQPGVPEIEAARTTLQPAWEQPHNRPKKGGK